MGGCPTGTFINPEALTRQASHRKEKGKDSKDPDGDGAIGSALKECVEAIDERV